MCGPGTDVAGDMWLHGPTSTRCGHRSPSSARKAMFVYPSAQPATIIVGQTIRSYRGRSEPCLQ